MSQIPDESAPGQIPAPQGQVAPAPAAMAPAPAATGTESEYIQVQRDQFAPWNGDMHEVRRLANLGRQAETERLFDLGKAITGGGMTVDQTIGLFDAPPEDQPQQPQYQPQPQQAGQQPQGYPQQQQQQYPPQAPQQQPSLQELFAQQDAKSDERLRKAFFDRDASRQQADRARVLEDARGAESRAADDFAKAYGMEIPVDGTSNPRLDIVRGAFHKSLENLKSARVPAYIQDNAQWMDRYNEPCSEELMAQALESSKKTIADFTNENVAAFAQQQTTAAGLQASLGEGAAGSVAPDPQTMTREQEMEAVAGHVQD